MDQKETTLTQGRVSVTLLQFALPFLLANLLQALYGAADLLIVGQFASSAGVSAVATGSQVMQTITGIVLGLTTGGTVLIGQYLGAGKSRDITETIGTMATVFGGMAVILTVIMLTLTNSITRIMHTPVEAIEATKQYVFICSIGIPFIIGYNVVSGILRGLGNSKASLRFIAVACFTNILGDLLLVRGFEMGAAGAAIATVFAQGLSFIMGLTYIKKHGLVYGFQKKYFRFKLEKAGKTLKLGMPIAMQDGLINISFLLITAIINAMGLVASASVGVVEKLIVFTMLPTTAFASAIAVMTAQNIGAGKLIRAKRSLYWGIGFSLIFGITCFSFAQIRPDILTGFFTTDPAVIEMASQYLRTYSIDCILVCFVFCMNSFFSGCGHSLFPMFHSLIATFLFRIPISAFLSRMENITLYEIGLAAPTATFVSVIFCMVYLQSGKWKVNKIVT